MPEGDGYSGGGKYKRLRVDEGEPGFWMARQFAVSYEFSFTTRLVLKFSTPVNAILYQGRITLDASNMRYRVFAFPNDSIETVAFTTPIVIHPLNIMSISPPYTGQVTGFVGGDIDTTGLNPFPTARIRVATASGQTATASAQPGQTRGFGPGNAYIVMTRIDGADAVTGVLDLRFEERDWGY